MSAHCSSSGSGASLSIRRICVCRLRSCAGLDDAVPAGRAVALENTQAGTQRRRIAGRAGSNDMTALLEAVGVSKRFGGLDALTDISLSINGNEIYGLIGPNGAGKTTFFNVLTGFYEASAGRFMLDGREL